VIDEKLIATLKEQHGDRLELVADEDLGIEVVVRPPTDAEWDRFVAQGSDESQRHHAPKSLARACVVYPAGDELRALLQKYPAFTVSISKELVEMAGATRAVRRKKL
jgi:bifunctional DNA-binding transcriptional regulator/antitoxin component of YhaV-PrlF toxin-antitoxin module